MRIQEKLLKSWVEKMIKILKICAGIHEDDREITLGSNNKDNIFLLLKCYNTSINVIIPV
jgi:hypothetical protein